MQHAQISTEQTLDSQTLLKAMLNGIHHVFTVSEHLDRINVFPVADGDTGTNMALTLDAVRQSLQRTAPASVGALLTQIADAALDGARGNSGAILANFFQGLSDHSGAEVTLSPRHWARSVSEGARYARLAVSSPNEGTVLSVIDAFSAAYTQATQARPMDLAGTLRTAIEQAQVALTDTQFQLAELQSAQVVDAGAAGMMALLEGFTRHLESGELIDADVRFATMPLEPERAGSSNPLEHRWCTECLISGHSLDTRRLREELAAKGSSLVIAGSHEKLRIHVHVTDPAEVFRIAAQYGSISGQKADDMQRQQASAEHGAKRPVAIVTDSAADLPTGEMERLDIHVVPLRLHFGKDSFLDKIGLSQEAFYERLARDSAHPKTSQPPPGDFRRVFDVLASHHERVIAILLSSRASGTWQSAEAAASRASGSARITVFDSLNASAGQALVVLSAAECAAQGADAQEIGRVIVRMRALTHTFASCQTLEYAVRGGRIPRWAFSLTRLLRISPLLGVRADGRIGLGGVLWGTTHLTAKFERFLSRRLKPDKRYKIIIAHGGAALEGQRLLDALHAKHGNIDGAWLVPTGAAIGVHGGPGFLVAGLQEQAPVDR